MTKATPLHPDMLFSQAATELIDKLTLNLPGSNVRYFAPRTLEDFRQYADAAGKMFDTMALREIEWWKIHFYHKARALNDARAEDSDPPLPLWEKPAGANKIIQETNFLRRVMRKAGAWTAEHEANYQPLQHVESDIPRALSPEEQSHWLQTAAEKLEWRLVRLFSIATLATAANHYESRRLKRGDINTFCPTVTIRAASAKNKYRIRTIPIDSDSEAVWAFETLLDRASSIGCREPHHHLFPYRLPGGLYVPTKPMSVHGLYRKWDEVSEASGLGWFTPNMLRHTALTRWAESGMPIHVIMSMAGHISRKMQEHYIHISESAKRKSVRGVTLAARQRVSGQW